MAKRKRPITATPGNQLVRALKVALPKHPDGDVSRSACVCVALVLYALADSEGYVRRPLSYIADFAALHTRTVALAVDALVDCGMLWRLRKRYGRQPAAYMLPWAQIRRGPSPVAEVAPGRRRASAPSRT